MVCSTQLLSCYSTISLPDACISDKESAFVLSNFVNSKKLEIKLRILYNVRMRKIVTSYLLLLLSLLLFRWAISQHGDDILSENLVKNGLAACDPDMRTKVTVDVSRFIIIVVFITLLIIEATVNCASISCFYSRLSLPLSPSLSPCLSLYLSVSLSISSSLSPTFSVSLFASLYLSRVFCFPPHFMSTSAAMSF